LKTQNQQFQEFTVPNSQHQQTLDFLNRLDEKIQRSVNSIEYWSLTDKPIQKFQNDLDLAQSMSNNADTLWRKGDYTGAIDLINQANILLDDIPQAPANVQSPGTTLVQSTVDKSGTFQESVIVTSNDLHAKLEINRGVVGKTIEGKPLSFISISPVSAPLPPLDNYSILNHVYDIGPKGATFSPQITISFDYNLNYLSQNITIQDLRIATYNQDSNKWIVLDNSVVNVNQKSISASINHFTIFAVVYKLPTPTPIHGMAGWLIAIIVVVVIVVILVIIMISRKRLND
jgi:hypothetical protein